MKKTGDEQNIPRPFNPLVEKIFEAFFIPLRKLLIQDLKFINLPDSLPENRPVLLVGNHMSNWDGFLFWEIQKKIKPTWPIYSVMLEKELKQHPIIRWLGGVGIDANSPSSIGHALRKIKGLRKTKTDFFLSYFPQGKIYPSFKRPLEFQGGIDLFIRAMAPLTIIPVGLHLEPMRSLKPTIFISLGRPMKIDKPSTVYRVLEDLVQAELDKIQTHLSREGESYSTLSSGIKVSTLHSRS